MQTVEVVLTAHPTQVMRRSLQHKQCRVGQLLQELERSGAAAAPGAKEELTRALFREVMATWQTDELRRSKPTPVEEAKGGLHILEQSLWTAVPTYVRKLSDSVRAVCGRELPLDATPIRFASWMGGDRDGNPNVTSKARAACSSADVPSATRPWCCLCPVELGLCRVEVLATTVRTCC
jgi:phosphoenolpyruvate carboxylase